MKSSWLIGRIVFALLGIFVLGIVVGRLTAPSAAEPLEIVIVDEKSNEFKNPKIRKVTRRAMIKFRQKLQLTPTQVRDVAPLFLETTKTMEMLEPGSEARLEVLEEFHQKLGQCLTPEQRVLANEMLENSRSKDRTN